MKKLILIILTVILCCGFSMNLAAQETVSLGNGWYTWIEPTAGFGNTLIGNITYYNRISEKDDKIACTFMYRITDGRPESISLTWSNMGTVKNDVNVRIDYITDGYISKYEYTVMQPGSDGDIRTIKLTSRKNGFINVISHLSKGKGHSVKFTTGNHTVIVPAPDSGFDY